MHPFLSSRFRGRRAVNSLLHRSSRTSRTPLAVQHVQPQFWQDSPPALPQGYKLAHKMAQRFQKARRSPNGETSVSRVYREANTKEPCEYWEYENLAISWGCDSICQCCRRRALRLPCFVLALIRTPACRLLQLCNG